MPPPSLAEAMKLALDWIKRFKGPAYLLLNKIDMVAKPLLLPLIARYNEDFQFAETFPISAIDGRGLDDLVKSWIARLPEGPKYFPDDQVTDQPERFLAAEVIREKAILATRQEVPHAIAVLVDKYEEKPKLLRISATIYVEREGQKGDLDRRRRRHSEADRHRRAQGTRVAARLQDLHGIIREGAK